MASDIKNKCNGVLLKYIHILEIEDITSDTNENSILPLIFIGVIAAVCQEAGVSETERNEVMAYCLSALLGQEIEVAAEYVEQANVQISSDLNSFHAIAFHQGKNSYSYFSIGNEFAVYDIITSTIDYIESNFL